MLTISQYLSQHPEYAFDFRLPMREQPRVFDRATLGELAPELKASGPYQKGSRGRPNHNQTRTHSQCGTCHRVLRNDLFYTPPSMQRRNLVYTNCLKCAQLLNAEHYDRQTAIARRARQAIWAYLAPTCLVCGFDRHPSAMELHSPKSDHSEKKIKKLVDEFSKTASSGKAEQLLREASRCIPLCSNCHRMLHAQVVELPIDYPRMRYHLAELLAVLET